MSSKNTTSAAGLQPVLIAKHLAYLTKHVHHPCYPSHTAETAIVMQTRVSLGPSPSLTKATGHSAASQQPGEPLSTTDNDSLSSMATHACPLGLGLFICVRLWLGLSESSSSGPVCVSACVTRAGARWEKGMCGAGESVKERVNSIPITHHLTRTEKKTLHKLISPQPHSALKIITMEQLPQKNQTASYILLNFRVNSLSAGPMNNPCGNFFLSPFLFLAFWWSKIRSKKQQKG